MSLPTPGQEGAADRAGAVPAPTEGRVAEGMLLQGRIEENSFADLLKSLVRSRDTALLTLTRDAARKTVYVQEGRIVFASSSESDDRLGECLLREGMITVEQYDQSVGLIRPGKRQGTILVEHGYITPAELVRGVKLQVEHIVLDLFRWRSGEFRIEIREIDTRDVITLNISTENLVFTGVKRGSGWSQILRGLGGTLDTVLDRATDADSRLYSPDYSAFVIRSARILQRMATVIVERQDDPQAIAFRKAIVAWFLEREVGELASYVDDGTLLAAEDVALDVAAHVASMERTRARRLQALDAFVAHHGAQSVREALATYGIDTSVDLVALGDATWPIARAALGGDAPRKLVTTMVHAFFASLGSAENPT